MLFRMDQAGFIAADTSYRRSKVAKRPRQCSLHARSEVAAQAPLGQGQNGIFV